MSANRFGEKFQLITFGESHGVALGAVIEGCPAGVSFDSDLLERQLQRRRPGSSQTVSQRKETDQPEVLSGVFAGKTLGTPIAILVRNQDARSSDYEKIKTTPRAGHADDVWTSKFGLSDHRGGGRSSGRETVSRVIGGSVAQMVLRHLYPRLEVRGFASRLGPFELTANEVQMFVDSAQMADEYLGRFPSSRHQDMAAALARAQEAGESWGGQAQIIIQNVPSGLGQPVFRKLKSDLASALLSVGATSGIEIGAGHQAAREKGTEFHNQEVSPYGGIRGGISTGENIEITVSFKPTSSLLDVAKKGRHDPCIVPRAIPVLESMVHLVLVDHALWMRTDRIEA